MLNILYNMSQNIILFIRNLPNKILYRSIASSKMSGGTVILNTIPRGKYAPSVSPYPLKLETYLRLAKIPYKPDFSKPYGPKGKLPWISYNGINMGDTTLCMEFLNKEFKVNLDEHLSAEEKAVARSIKIMVEEHLYWTLALYRWVYDPSKVACKLMDWPYPLFEHIGFRVIRRKIQQQAYNQGLGRHSKDEVIEMGLKDLQALSDFLGDNPYMMGSKVCELDCTAFGMLSQIVFQKVEGIPLSKYQITLDNELVNLKNYCLRMRDEVWPDWNDILKK